MTRSWTLEWHERLERWDCGIRETKNTFTTVLVGSSGGQN